jgi:hypothetical protein
MKHHGKKIIDTAFSLYQESWLCIKAGKDWGFFNVWRKRTMDKFET